MWVKVPIGTEFLLWVHVCLLCGWRGPSGRDFCSYAAASSRDEFACCIWMYRWRLGAINALDWGSFKIHLGAHIYGLRPQSSSNGSRKPR